MAKGKGSSWERDIAKMLTKWVTGAEKPYVFWRSPGSGAMATISEENKEISGDIYTLRPEGAFFTDTFSVECKTGYPLSSFHKCLKGTKTDEIRDFWEQSCRDAKNASKIPMLIYKKKNYNALVGIPVSCPLSEKLNKLPSISVNFDAKYDLPSVILVDMKEFFEIITPDDVRSL